MEEQNQPDCNQQYPSNGAGRWKKSLCFALGKLKLRMPAISLVYWSAVVNKIDISQKELCSSSVKVHEHLISHSELSYIRDRSQNHFFFMRSVIVMLREGVAICDAILPQCDMIEKDEAISLALGLAHTGTPVEIPCQPCWVIDVMCWTFYAFAFTMTVSVRLTALKQHLAMS